MYAAPIKNLKNDTLINAVTALTKVNAHPPLLQLAFGFNIFFLLQTREFKDMRTLLFDGESALRSQTVQRDIKNKLKVKIHAEPLWKRSMAERAIREIKLRMAVRLDFEGKFCVAKHTIRIIKYTK